MVIGVRIQFMGRASFFMCGARSFMGRDESYMCGTNPYTGRALSFMGCQLDFMRHRLEYMGHDESFMCGANPYMGRAEPSMCIKEIKNVSQMKSPLNFPFNTFWKSIFNINHH